ncbi:MAG: MBL fold metallo-hydrolase [Candidatus Latescibacteria bacterium]|nr:MBL fold metallo-hydrolase [Candidatus Latescibacterota bacterium]
MKATFWGTRGSIPTPLTFGECRAKAKRLLMNARNVDLSDEAAVESYLRSRPLPEAMTFGGNTPCVEVVEDSSRLILDCGSGMHTLGRHMIASGFSAGEEIHILQTHTHWDHIMGFPFFAPAYTKGTTIHIHGVHPHLEERFAQQMDLIHFPITMDDMAADIVFHQVEKDVTTNLGPFTIRNKALFHPGGSYSYRIEAGGKTLVFATDGEYKEPTEEIYRPFIEYYRGADVLIFDAMYSTLEKTIERENYGHSTPVIGLRLALSAGVKTLVLFHHDPECNDAQIAQSFYEAKEFLEIRGKSISEKPLELITAFDGLMIDV